MGWPHWNVLPKPPGHLPTTLAPPPRPEFQVLPKPIPAPSTFPGRLCQHGDIKQEYPPSLVKVCGCKEQGQESPVVMATRISDHTRQCLNICKLTGLSSDQP